MNNKEEIKLEAEYCLNCKNKNCQKGCPLGNNIPEFIMFIKEEKWQEAYNILNETTVLPAICGRVCPHEKQCQGQCVRAIKGKAVNIGVLEAFLGELANNGEVQTNYNIDKKEQSIAVIGAGPTGLTAAAFLARKGYNVTIFEREKSLGGVLSYGIPEFRLPPEIVKKNIENILKLGIKVKTNIELGKQISIEELKNKYDAVFLSLGSKFALRMNIPGEDLKNVHFATELLRTKEYPDFNNKKVVVIGAGNVAMDISRKAKMVGAKEVTIMYRRTEEFMPAEKKEIENAKNEEVKFLFETNITKIIGQEKVEKIECIKTELVQEETGKSHIINKERKRIFTRCRLCNYSNRVSF